MNANVKKEIIETFIHLPDIMIGMTLETHTCTQKQTYTHSMHTHACMEKHMDTDTCTHPK